MSTKDAEMSVLLLENIKRNELSAGMNAVRDAHTFSVKEGWNEPF